MRSAEGWVTDAAGCLAAGFFAAGFFFLADFFFGSGAVTLPSAEVAEASSAVLFSTVVFGFLGTVCSVLSVVRPNTAWSGGASGFCKATVA